MFDDGILSFYERLPDRISPGGRPLVVLSLYADSYYESLDFTTKEYYAAKQSQTKIEKKIRIPQDRQISNQHVAILDGVAYGVGRTYSSTAKGEPVTDITLERVITGYEIAALP